MPYMTDVDYGRLHALLEVGKSVAEVAKRLKCSHRTVRYWRNKGPPSVKAKCARKATPQQTKRRQLVKKLIRTVVHREAEAFTPKRRARKVRVIKLYPYNSPKKVARALASKHNIEVAASTVRRDLLQMGLRALVCRPGPIMTAEHKRNRVAFCRHVLAAPDDLEIMFSDEKQFDSNQTQRRYQWLPLGSTPDNRNVEQGPPKVTLWGCIGIGFRHVVILPRVTLTMELYKNAILAGSIPVIKAYQQQRPNSVFQQDNAPCHSRSSVYLKKKRIQLLPWKWPAVSCDLSPIEQLWQWIDDAVQLRGPYGVEELQQFIEEELAKIPQERIDRLVRSFRKRCQRVIAANGEVIKP